MLSGNYRLAFQSNTLKEENEYFGIIFLLVYTMSECFFFFSIGEDPCLLNFIFEGRRDWKMACDLITCFCVLTSNRFFIELPVKD